MCGKGSMEIIQKIRAIFNSKALGAVLRWSKGVHGRILLICVLGVVSTLVSLGIPLASKGLIDGATSSNSEVLWKYGILLAALMLGSRGLGVVTAWVRTRASAKLQREMQSMFAQRLLTRDYASLKAFHSGEMVNRFFSDTSVVKNGVLNILPGAISIAVSFVGAAVILISMDWRFVPLLIAGGVLGLIIVLLFRNPVKKRHKRMQEAEDALHAVAQETLENIRLVKASVSENRAAGKIGARQEHLETEQVRQSKFNIAMNNGIGLVFDLSWLFCMLWGCFGIYRGALTYGSLMAIVQLIGRIESPIANAVGLASDVYGVIASAERLQEMTDLPDDEKGETLKDFDAIALENVSFRYEEESDTVLANVNHMIRKGDFMALTGVSGGGKTSLFQLLLGIYRPTSGRVDFLLGDKRIPASRGTRGLFAYVPQGNTLFSGTLRENLTMFTDHAEEEEIAEAVKAACIDDLVAEIGLNAVLGERGVGLSEGQAQRVGIARALLSKAPILLLDEATSALDEETEARLLKNISAMRNKTCIIVTHRRAALAICDYELHIAGGQIKQEGTNT